MVEVKKNKISISKVYYVSLIEGRRSHCFSSLGYGIHCRPCIYDKISWSHSHIEPLRWRDHGFSRSRDSAPFLLSKHICCSANWKSAFPNAYVKLLCEYYLKFLLNIIIRFGLEPLRYATVAVLISDWPCIHTLWSNLRSVAKWFSYGKHLNLIHSDVTLKTLFKSHTIEQKLCFFFQHRKNCNCSKVRKTIRFLVPNNLFWCVNTTIYKRLLRERSVAKWINQLVRK